MTVNQQDPSERAKPGTVTRVFRSIAPAILWITLANGTVLGTTPDHEVWTHEAGWTVAKRVEVGDSFNTRDGSCVVVTHLRLDPTPTEVFNLEVAGTNTYFVSNVWVHNCPVGRRGNPMDVPRGTNASRRIGNRDYSGHALDEMQSDGLTPSVIEDAIAGSRGVPGKTPGSSVHYDPTNNVSVVVDDASGSVITTSRGHLR